MPCLTRGITYLNCSHVLPIYGSRLFLPILSRHLYDLPFYYRAFFHILCFMYAHIKPVRAIDSILSVSAPVRRIYYLWWSHSYLSRNTRIYYLWWSELVGCSVISTVFRFTGANLVVYLEQGGNMKLLRVFIVAVTAFQFGLVAANNLPS